MSYFQLFSLHNLALLHDWLEENGELLVDIYRPHSGGSGFQYFIHSLEELKTLVEAEVWEVITITIFRQKQFSLRGVANEKMLEAALSQIKDGEYYTIISLKKEFSKPIEVLADGNKHSEISHDFSKFIGQEIGFGQDPFDINQDEQLIKDRNNIFRLSVTKNSGYYEEFAKNPEKYEWLKKILVK